MKFITLLLITGMVMAMLVGCGNKASETDSGSETKTTEGSSKSTETSKDSEKPFEGTTITLSCASTPYVLTIEKHLDEFFEETGIKVEIDQLSNEQLSNKIAVSSAARGTDLDVIAYRPIQENKLFIHNGWLTPLDGFIADSSEWDYDDYTDPSKEITSDANGTAFGIPLVTEREILYYNKELLAAAGFEDGPKDFDELVEYAKALNDPANNVYALGLRGQGNPAVTQFSGFLYGFGGDFFDENGNASINTPEFVKALQFYGELCRDYAPEGVMNANWEDTSNWFTQGIVAMRIDCDSQYSYALDPEKSLIHDKVGYSVLPGGTAGSKPFSIVAWALGISEFSENKEAAWEFIKWATSKEMDLEAQLEGNFSARKSTWADPASTENVPEQLVKVIEESDKIAVAYDRPYMKDGGEARNIIGELITKAIEGVSDEELQAACEEVNQKVQELVDAENK